MSRWLTDELYISLGPDQVGLVQIRRSFSLGKIKREIVARQSLNCAAAKNGGDWGPALQAMDTMIAQYAEDRPHVFIVLSNHFVRYTLVPWSDLISGEAQQLSYTRHCFHTTYGALSDAWVLRMSRSVVGSSQVASAIDENLLLECNERVKRHGLKLASVQPYLMSAFNQLKLNFDGVNAWFALVEKGIICLARLQADNWISLRVARLNDSWDEFSRFMVREALVENCDLENTEQVLYLYAPHRGNFETIEGWRIVELPSPLPVGLAEEKELSLVMALSGTING